mgnify:CR=1 FL=1
MIALIILAAQMTLNSCTLLDSEKEPPKCYPLRQPKAARYRHAPATHSPNEWAWEPHLAEYYVNNTKMYHLPSPVTINIDTVIDGKRVVANVKEKGVVV